VIEILDHAWEEPLRSCREMLSAKLREATGDEVRQISFTLADQHPA
jgi:hypothetical protein